MAKRSIADLLGGETRFGRLTLIGEGEPYETKDHPLRRGRFRCDCGNIRDMMPAKVRSGVYQSCGCYASDASRARFTKHGGCRTPEYKSWLAMTQRCLNPNSTSYPRYGGRGISVCGQWQGPDGFLQFVRDMGARPEGHSLDRIDCDGNYEPGNTRWASAKVQMNNRRVSVLITAGGITLPQAEWARRTGLGKNTIAERIKNGWPPAVAAVTPARVRRP